VVELALVQRAHGVAVRVDVDQTHGLARADRLENREADRVVPAHGEGRHPLSHDLSVASRDLLDRRVESVARREPHVAPVGHAAQVEGNHLGLVVHRARRHRGGVADLARPVARARPVGHAQVEGHAEQRDVDLREIRPVRCAQQGRKLRIGRLRRDAPPLRILRVILQHLPVLQVEGVSLRELVELLGHAGPPGRIDRAITCPHASACATSSGVVCE
jgi:hypothetical protein